MRRVAFIVLGIMMAGLVNAQPLTENEQTFFRQQMENQQKSWNMADIDGFMSYYWGSDSLIFVTEGKAKRGWQFIRDSYERTYPDTKSMGQLTYSNLYFYKLDKKKIFCSGSWKITREDGELQGDFSLIWKKIKNRWVIIIDHTE